MIVAVRHSRWLVLGVLSLVYACNVADRLILSILAQAIKVDLRLSDFAVGLLIGPAIAFFYAALGIPMAYVADRVNRVHFLALCLTLWSILTAAGWAAGSALQLGLTRIGVSAVEAGGSPAASSIIADYFPVRQRPTAMGIYSSAATIGVLVSFGFGGLLSAAYGWRWTLVIAGVPGVLLALLLLATVAEPTRGAQDRAALAPPPSLWNGLRTLWHLPLYREVVIAASISNFCFHAVLNWGPSLLQRKFFTGSGHAGVSLGIGIAVCGGVAGIVSGRVISAFMASGISRPLRIAAWFQLLAAPLVFMAMFTERFDVSLVLLCVAYGLQACFIPIYWSVAQSHVPCEMRAMAAAVLLLTAAVLGPGLSAPLVGAVSDALKPSYGDASLQNALAIGTVVNVLVALLLWRAARTARRAETIWLPAAP